MKERVKEFLNLIPESVLCPFCGETHKIKRWQPLKFYDSKTSLKVECPKCPKGKENSKDRWDFQMNFDGERLNINLQTCWQHRYYPIQYDIVDVFENVRAVTFRITEDNLICGSCPEDTCIKPTFTCGFIFSEEQWAKLHLQRKKVTGATLILQALNGAKQPEDNKIVPENCSIKKEDKPMKNNNNPFNINFEFGPNEDSNLASTLMGVAVKNSDDSWRIYDKIKGEITDVGNLQLGNFPLFILPSMKLEVGDLIKDAGEYYYVTKVDTQNQMVSVSTGEIKNIVPMKNILGFNVYAKVIAITDSLNLGELTGEKLAIMAMCGQGGDNSGMNQMLPLLLLKDKLGGGDDTMALAIIAMCGQCGDNSGMNQMLPLLLLKDKLGGGDDTMALAIMAMCGQGGDNSGMNQMLPFLLLKDKLGIGNNDKNATKDKIESKDEEN